MTVFVQIEALEYLHDHEYVHADIKGSNILIGHSAATKHKVSCGTHYSV